MSQDALILRVAARFLHADQPPGQRKKDKDLVKPVNRPKGIDRAIVKEHGKAMGDGHDDMVSPNRRDIRPEDVFVPKPNQTSVRNLAETGKDLAKVIEKQIPKDKGYATVKNLSQYLIETGGGGGTKPVK
jgi:hypothetical protein